MYASTGKNVHGSLAQQILKYQAHFTQLFITRLITMRCLSYSSCTDPQIGTLKLHTGYPPSEVEFAEHLEELLKPTHESNSK
jgi:hypothetical protein